jgi:hypothetical protein
VAGATIFIGGATIGLGADPPSLDFGPRPIGTAVRAITQVTLTGDPVTVAGVEVRPPLPDYVVRTDCSGLIGEGGCAVVVVFAPRGAGLRQTDVFISYNGPKSPLVIHLSGQGVP